MAVDLRTTLQEKSSWRDQGLWPPPGSPEDCPLSLGTELTVSSPLSPLSSQEEDFIRPSSREEAQQLWEAERVKMRQILDKQQKQMVEDNQWLRQEEKSLVSSRRAVGGMGHRSLQHCSRHFDRSACMGEMAMPSCRFVSSSTSPLSD